MSNHRRGVGPVAAFVVAGTIAAAAAVHTPSVVADHTTPPTSVTVAGSFQSELGCSGDWQPDCTATSMIEEDGVWQGTETVPAGSWAYKAALNMTWSESYGGPNGADIPLTLAADTAVRFYYSHATHWVADSVNDRIATAAGSFQSELGCSGDWQPDCLRSWLQDPDGDGVYELHTTEIPAGSYEWKVALAEAWDESYGGPGGANLAFTVASDDQPVTFRFDAATNAPTIEIGEGSGLEPGDAELVTAPVRTPATDEVVYFVMTDRFADGAPGNNRGGSPSDDRLVNGYDPTGKGWYHGGDLAGLRGHLDYLEGLGVTALWVTPPFTNRWVQGDLTPGGTSAGYHGYWQVDYTQIDPHLGTNAEMTALVADAHDQGHGGVLRHRPQPHRRCHRLRGLDRHLSQQDRLPVPRRLGDGVRRPDLRRRRGLPAARPGDQLPVHPDLRHARRRRGSSSRPGSTTRPITTTGATRRSSARTRCTATSSVSTTCSPSSRPSSTG